MINYGLIAASLLYLVYGLAVVRTTHYARSMNVVWNNDPSREWNQGKWAIAAGVIGLFLFTQQIEPLPDTIKAIGVFTCLVLLPYGEWRMGTGFKWVVEAQRAAAHEAATIAEAPVAYNRRSTDRKDGGT